jgi:hypothetical protein
VDPQDVQAALRYGAELGRGDWQSVYK